MRGAGQLAGRLLKTFLSRAVPKVLKSTNTKLGRKQLFAELQKDALEISGVEGGKALINELMKHGKITYGKDGKVCIKYRKFKRCTKGNEK
jgi:hypothetical protein